MARLPPPLLLPLQPLLLHIAAEIARRRPEAFARLGPHKTARFVIDPVDLPFVLLLRPDPNRPSLRASAHSEYPAHDARIAAKFHHLLRMIDCGQDGDAMFFARDLSISGNTEAVVSLRNAIDDVDGSLAAIVADLFGTAGRALLALLRRAPTIRERFAQ